ncbi:MAG: hypothetical protein JKY43_00230 [Phycisphaerales bacterium]|nr:hypothetical protein [Phycisphaerales bacterium]
MAASPVQSAHLVTPIVRCLSNIRPRDAHDRQPTPFSKFLQANRLDRPGDTFELSTIHESPAKATQSAAGPMSTPLLPNLGEIVEVEPRPKLAGIETRLHQQMIPATGHALDIYA